MSQQRLTESQEKTEQQIARRETSPASAQLFQWGLQPIHQLQRTLGNRNVAQLIQTKRLTPEGKIISFQRKLTVGAADDQYEQEADRVARHVLNTSDAVAANSMQRAMSPEEDKDQMLQTKLLAASITPFVQRQMVHNEEPEDKEQSVQAKFFTETSKELLQRQPETEEEEAEPLQAKSAGSLADSFEAGADVETQVSQSKGRGSPLPDPVRTYMEPRFGADFSDVRVHSGSDALQMSQAVGAQAFTHGSDIYFGAGDSPSNLDLTAHELTHVVQQTGGAAFRKYKATVQASPPSRAFQHPAGNQVPAQVLARQPVKARITGEEAVAISADYTNAVDYVNSFYGGVREVLELRDKVHNVAIENFVTFGKLKDPPSLPDAIIAEIFKQAFNVIPGGSVIKAALAGGSFALDMARLKKDLEAHPGPGMSIEEEAKRGPSDKNKAKAEKRYELGKDIGKGVVDVVDKAKETLAKQKEATEAEASAKEVAGLQSRRIEGWTAGTVKSRDEEDQIKKWLAYAQQNNTRPGNLEAMVKQRLGEIPEVSVLLQHELERQHELALYAQKLEFVASTRYSNYFGTETRPEWRIEISGGGGQISSATYRRITHLLGVAPTMVQLYVAYRLGLKQSKRRELSPDPPGTARLDV